MSTFVFHVRAYLYMALRIDICCRFCFYNWTKRWKAAIFELAREQNAWSDRTSFTNRTKMENESGASAAVDASQGSLMEQQLKLMQQMIELQRENNELRRTMSSSGSSSSNARKPDRPTIEPDSSDNDWAIFLDSWSR